MERLVAYAASLSFMYAAAWLGIAKKRAHESLCVKSRAEYEGPMGVSIGPFASISNQ